MEQKLPAAEIMHSRINKQLQLILELIESIPEYFYMRRDNSIVPTVGESVRHMLEQYTYCLKSFQGKPVDYSSKNRCIELQESVEAAKKFCTSLIKDFNNIPLENWYEESIPIDIPLKFQGGDVLKIQQHQSIFSISYSVIDHTKHHMEGITTLYVLMGIERLLPSLWVDSSKNLSTKKYERESVK